MLNSILYNILHLHPVLYNIIHAVLVLSFLIMSLNVPTLRMKIIGLFLTVVNYLLFLK